MFSLFAEQFFNTQSPGELAPARCLHGWLSSLRVPLLPYPRPYRLAARWLLPQSVNTTTLLHKTLQRAFPPHQVEADWLAEYAAIVLTLHSTSPTTLYSPREDTGTDAPQETTVFASPFYLRSPWTCHSSAAGPSDCTFLPRKPAACSPYPRLISLRVGFQNLKARITGPH